MCIYIISFIPSKSLKRQMSLPLFYRWSNWDLEKTVYLRSIMLLVISGARIQTQVCLTPRKMLWTTSPLAWSESQSPWMGNRSVQIVQEVQNQTHLISEISWSMCKRCTSPKLRLSFIGTQNHWYQAPTQETGTLSNLPAVTYYKYHPCE